MNISYRVGKKNFREFSAAQFMQQRLYRKFQRRFPIITYIDGDRIEAC